MPHLLGAMLRGGMDQGMNVLRREGRVTRGIEARRGIGLTSLEPDLIDVVASPVGEEADAVGAAHDLVEMLAQRRDREILVDLLADGERGLKMQREFRDDAQCAEADDGAFEGVSREGLHGSIRGDDFHRADDAGQDLIPVSRSVRRGGACAGDGDVRQGGQVVQRVTFAIQERRELTIGHAGFHGDCRWGDGWVGDVWRGFVQIEADDSIEMLGGDQIAAGEVGDRVEGMARAQGADFVSIARRVRKPHRRNWESEPALRSSRDCRPSSAWMNLRADGNAAWDERAVWQTSRANRGSS